MTAGGSLISQRTGSRLNVHVRLPGRVRSQLQPAWMRSLRVISTLGVWTKLEAVRGIGTGRPAEVGMLSAQRSRTAEAELQTAAVANHHRGNPRKVHHAVPACRTVAETDITAPADDRTARCPAMCGTRAGTPLTATVTGVEGTADRAALIPSISRGWMTGEANGVVADNRPENSIDAATRYPQERLEGPVMIAPPSLPPPPPPPPPVPRQQQLSARASTQASSPAATERGRQTHLQAVPAAPGLQLPEDSISPVMPATPMGDTPSVSPSCMIAPGEGRYPLQAPGGDDPQPRLPPPPMLPPPSVHSTALDFRSPAFDALKALYTPGLMPPNPRALPLDYVDKCRSLLPPGDSNYSSPVDRSGPSKTQAAREQQAQRTCTAAARQAQAALRTSPLQAIADEVRKGPLMILKRAYEERLMVRLVTRHACGVRGVAVGTLVGFDKHMNLLMRDVEETYTVLLNVCRVLPPRALTISHPPAAGLDGPPPPQQRMRRGRKQEVRTRKLKQIFVRGDNVVLISLVVDRPAAITVRPPTAVELGLVTDPAVLSGQPPPIERPAH
eukprot:CAMPEP_0206138756 /NCGR_PEP_ID=MMETSP1473-20131121/3538_1 /ASSEMBLY_ACC=CAM_ASM_001109 /TAXON_ID=1461547 /ORGANISM="Stichococcus sp, Strain RCC1054" /LENGTH=557 /DNA_ID=CAMNT_0053532269 /DNA_START=185 /DNA_END=1857 /DNA_ORIENTATION=-